MKKSAKIITALTLIIQLLIPSYLLVHHYTLINTALKSEDEYMFEIDIIHFDHKNIFNYSADGINSFYFEIFDFMPLDTEKIAVEKDEDGQLTVKELTKDNKTDVWFNYDYYSKNSFFTRGEYQFESTDNISTLITSINKEYYALSTKDEVRNPAYVSVKIYKGIFIPTAIYFNGEKILTITKKN